MECEQVLELLPDYALGTLSETEQASVRKHLRGCGACRADAALLDRGVAMFASAAHALDPPADLRDRTLGVLAEEWAETPAPPAPRRRRFVAWLAVAAAVVALAGALTWGSVAQSNANRAQTALGGLREDALAYRAFLHALGGKEVRVGTLRGTGDVSLEGTAVLYDADTGRQSWGLVLATVLPGYEQPLTVQLVSTDGRVIPLPFPMEFNAEGEGAAWLVTAADIGSFHSVRLVGPDGVVVAQGTVA